MAAASELSIMAFPQSWDGTRLVLNALIVPRSDPLSSPPGFPAGSPSFAKAHLKLQAALIPGLVNLPDPSDPGRKNTSLGTSPPVGAEALFTALKTKFTIPPSPPPQSPRRAGILVQKYLPQSYRSAIPFERPATPYGVTGKEFECGVRDEGHPAPPKKPPPPPDTTWGKVLSLALRQPLLGKALGMIYQGLAITPAAADVAAGAWLFLALDAGSDYGTAPYGPGGVQYYAARLPPLQAGHARSVFGAVLFPVKTGNTSTYDSVFPQAEDYDDGFAKIVHGSQPRTADAASEAPGSLPAVTDAGIQLGWDDEQVATWLNRQITTDAATVDQQAPLGILGYRVDVRKDADPTWRSLSLWQGTLSVDAISVGKADGTEGCIETVPARMRDTASTYWLPMYFAQWRGKSLVLPDDLGYHLSGADPLPARALSPVLAAVPPLRYGSSYQFRVRLCDLSGGGPALADAPANPAPAPVATCPFRRFVKPKAVRRPAPADDPPPAAGVVQTTYRIYRPLLAYPDFVFAGDPTDPASLDVAAAKAAGVDVGVPDPDVRWLEITVLVRIPAGDAPSAPGDDGFRVLLTTQREFPADKAQPLDLQLSFTDQKNAEPSPPPVIPSTGPVPVPTARDLRVRLRTICREDPTLAYFGEDAARIGQPYELPMRRGIAAAPGYQLVFRKDASTEMALFVPSTPAQRLNAVVLQPDNPTAQPVLLVPQFVVGAPPSGNAAAQRLGQQLGLEINGLTLSGRDGRRTVFAAGNGLRYSVAGDRSSLTLSNESDLFGHWLVALRVSLDRDWTWDGLADRGIVVKRNGVEVGAIQVPFRVDPGALTGQPNRAAIDLVFLDAVDATPEPGSFPRELDLSYELDPQLVGSPTADGPLMLAVHLPVTTAPAQVPQLVSAGIALSQYQRSADYSSSDPRQRMLWLEFAEAIADDGQDEYFARVLAYAPDPLLSFPHAGQPAPAEPPLPVPPEPIRVIVPGQSDDSSGLHAMQPLIQSSSKRHYLVPLPPGVDAESLLLFGFFTYELRVGHVGQWSTAQARFGRPLRVAGVQHPAPTLQCLVRHDPQVVRVRAPFATPVTRDGTHTNEVRGIARPQTQLWALLYTQVAQMDGVDRRNVLLDRRACQPVSGERDAYGETQWAQREISAFLDQRCLPNTAPLSVLAVELLVEETPPVDPLGSELGRARILRASPLVPVPAVCVQ
jgi:hypothetical protein